jgi:uncharacterized protein (DUF488 family)
LNAEIYTVGHSTHAADAFRLLLGRHHIAAAADVRRYPASRRNPQFNADVLAAALAADDVELVPFGETLGGRRRTAAGSQNGGWRVAGFRAYADHMASDAFADGLGELEALARRRAVAVMCAEADWHRCHRRLISDALVVRGWRVLHIGADGALAAHELTPFAVLEEGRITYPPAQQTID